MTDAILITVLALPLALALAMPAAGRRLGPRTAWAALPAPLVAAALLGWLAWSSTTGPLPSVVIPWIPAMGIDLVLRPDGLALFFALVVTVIGALVVFYAAFYLDDHYRDHGKFYAALLLFMGAMLGTVLAGNLMQMFVFWELTGIASFLLIGFKHEDKKSAYGARMALLVTAGTGLFLLVGVVLLGRAFGTFDLDVILTGAPQPEHAGLLPWAFACCVIGIFGKSAQFPFFFWLPNAMAAPTPVSAYLHSATMVKLGVFLTARLLPVFNGLEGWTETLTIVGFGTMLLGAALAVVSHDLKAILAYSTVSQLGLLIGYYGLFPAGTSVVWDYLHILNHVFYKACLFMVAGIIDHSTGTRDLRQLGGLGRKMPWTAAAALVGVATMGGVPFTTGFLSKEMLLGTTTEFWRGREFLADWVFFTVIIGSILKIVFSIRIFHAAFLGKPGAQVEQHFHAPSFGMQLPPLVLAAAAVVFGIAATSLGALGEVFSISGKHADRMGELHIWHGLTFELALSLGIVAAGALLYLALRARVQSWSRPRWLAFDDVFNDLVDAMPRVGTATFRFTRAAHPRHYLPVVLGTALLLWGAWWLVYGGSYPASWWTSLAVWPEAAYGYHRFFVVFLCAGGLLTLVVARDWILQLLSLAVVGFLLSFYYVLYKAPDLALTQILIETATLLLVLMFIMRVRRASGRRKERILTSRADRFTRAVLATAAGIMVPAMMLLFQGGGGDQRVGEAILARSVPDAKGANAVNTTLVDFRSLDTFFEILVLAIATLGCLGLLMRRRADAPPRPVAAHAGDRDDVTPVGDSFILSSVVTFLFFLINVFAVYLFLRGHNLPGGGFVAGLCTALSFVMLGFVQGIEKLHRFLRIDPMRLAIIGLLLALGAGAAGVIGGDAFLRQYHPYVHNVPLLGDVYLGTPLLFDLGVFFVVVGVVLKIVFPLVKSVQGFRAFVIEEQRVYASPEEEPVETNARNVGLPEPKDAP